MRRAARGLALLVALGGSSGCTVTAVSSRDDPRLSNTCESDSDCSSGNCGAGVCQAVSGQLEAVLIAVSPPTDSVLPHLEFITHLADVPPGGGSRDIELAEPGRVVGSLVISDRCYPTFVSPDPDTQIFGAQDGKSLPVQVLFERRERLLGVSQQSYFTRTAYYDEEGAYRFDLTVPIGDYDVYMVPPATLPSCPLPPQLRRGWSIKAGNFTVPFPVAPVSLLRVHVRWPKVNDSLKGWQIDIIEPIGGKPISTVATLGDPVEGEQTVEYLAELAYSEVIEPEDARPSIEAANDLLRLRPPAGVVAPTIFFDRSGLGLFGGIDVTLQDLASLPKAVTVEGQVVRADTGVPVRGSVTLLSTSINGVSRGVFASYQTTAMIDERGVFRVELPPGVYRVQAEPPLLVGEEQDGGLATHEASWDIPADVPFQAGKVLEVPPLSEVTGQSRFPGAQVQAVPTPVTVLPFEEGFGLGDFAPRAASGLVDELGQFLLLADPGRFDISVQAPESLGFAWYVRPGVDVRDSRLDLGRVTLPTPVALSGRVTIGDGATKLPVASGFVRAYAYLNNQLVSTGDPAEAVTVVQVAETRADDDGQFRLLLPSSITASK